MNRLVRIAVMAAALGISIKALLDQYKKDEEVIDALYEEQADTAVKSIREEIEKEENPVPDIDEITKRREDRLLNLQADLILANYSMEKALILRQTLYYNDVDKLKQLMMKYKNRGYRFSYEKSELIAIVVVSKDQAKAEILEFAHDVRSDAAQYKGFEIRPEA